MSAQNVGMYMCKSGISFMHNVWHFISVFISGIACLAFHLCIPYQYSTGSDIIIFGPLMSAKDPESIITLRSIVNYDDPKYMRKLLQLELTDAVKYITDNAFSKNNKILEVTDIAKKYYRVFFDIEGDIDSNLLGSLISDFKQFVKENYNIECTESWTENNKSVHGSYSYHVFFNIYCELELMLFVVNGFDLETKFKYHPYIDKCVYSYGRLFRVPLAYRPQQMNTKDPNDPRRVFDKNDFHKIISGSIEDCLISNIQGCTKIPSELITYLNFGSFDRHISTGTDVQYNPEDIEEVKKQFSSLEDVKRQLNELSKLFK